MDSYLSQRRKSDWGFFSKPVLHPTVHPYKNKEMKEESTVESSESTEQKKGWLSGMVDKLFGEAADEDVPAEAVSQVTSTDASADLKELARISLAVMKKMPGDLVHEFKQSADYDRFKELLRKHQLIK